MTSPGLTAALEKMEAAKIRPAAIKSFTHSYRELAAGSTGIVPEDTIDPVDNIPHLDELDATDEQQAAALNRTVVIRLNGGLGTSMGMEKAKSLLPVRGERTFLELMVAQIQYLRKTTGARLPFMVMNSFRTRQDCMAYLESVPGLVVDDLPLDFLQNAVPKLRTSDLSPVTWEQDPELEWCPPGHGDIFTTLYDSGLLAKLLEQGYRYLFIANGDNLGAFPDGRIAAYLAASGAPFLTEVTRRTPADVKGGHLAWRKADGQLILRETAQTAPEDLKYFMDGDRHPFAHCNNLWFDIKALQNRLTETEGVLGLPLIRNEKTVDPTDSDSPAVYQLETAMGAAVQCFAGAQALEVGRDRFLPVKTTNDLLLLRSDVYELGDDAVPKLRPSRAPLINLDPRYYKRIADFDARFPAGPPSLVDAVSLTVEGDWTFGANVQVRGAVTLNPSTTGAGRIPDASILA
ncbi:MAG: UTP--glucose-1-phosphate uridylyltransferase [Actinomycetaceae bacterium]|nr:UTP--glucose-1-phosphate uridylyltransferase [Actinomycetaceae bacterium]